MSKKRLTSSGAIVLGGNMEENIFTPLPPPYPPPSDNINGGRGVLTDITNTTSPLNHLPPLTKIDNAGGMQLMTSVAGGDHNYSRMMLNNDVMSGGSGSQLSLANRTAPSPLGGGGGGAGGFTPVQTASELKKVCVTLFFYLTLFYMLKISYYFTINYCTYKICTFTFDQNINMVKLFYKIAV